MLSYVLTLFLTGRSKTVFPSIITLQSFISTVGRYFVCTVLTFSFSNDNTKSLFTPWKLGSIKKSKHWFSHSGKTFGWYLFQLIVLLNPDFNCSSSFALSWVDKVTTRT